MASPKTAKAATALGSKRPSEIEQLGGRLNSEDSQNTHHLQVAKLTRRYAISVAMAAVLAPLCFGERYQ